MTSHPSIRRSARTRGRRDVGHAQVGGVVVQRRAVLAEQPAELGERLEVTAVGESRDAQGTPGASGHQPAFGRIDGGERRGRMPAGRAGVGAQGQDGGGDHVSGRGDEFHLIRLGHAGGLGGNVQSLVPAPGVDVCPPEDGQAPAAGAPYAGSPELLHGVLQQADRQVGFVQDPRGGTCSPQRGLFNGRAGDRAQAREELVSAADWVAAGAYPEPQYVDINASGPDGGRWTLAFQQVEGTADGLAASGHPGLVGDSSRTPERVPGEVRVVA